jgi:hypothetical protein
MIDMPSPESMGYVTLGAVFLLTGLVLLLRSWWRISAANRWPVVTGTVVHGWVATEKPKRFTFYRAIIAYTYRVAGQELSGGRICLLDDGQRGSVSDADADLARYRPGTIVAVHYDPAVPGRSCLIIDSPPRGALYVIALGLAVALFGLLFPDLL